MVLKIFYEIRRPFIGSFSWILSAISAISVSFCVCAVATTLCIVVDRWLNQITLSISSLIIFLATLLSRLRNCVEVRSPNSSPSSNFFVFLLFDSAWHLINSSLSSLFLYFSRTQVCGDMSVLGSWFGVVFFLVKMVVTWLPLWISLVGRRLFFLHFPYLEWTSYFLFVFFTHQLITDVWIAIIYCNLLTSLWSQLFTLRSCERMTLFSLHSIVFSHPRVLWWYIDLLLFTEFYKLLQRSVNCCSTL